MPDRDEILRVLDRGSGKFTFPALDNGYFYLAATRLSLHRSAEDWAIVFETFGSNPRHAAPYVDVTTFASRLNARDAPEKYASREAYQVYMAAHPNDDSRFFYPLDDYDWQDPEHDLVARDAGSINIRGAPQKLPALDEYERHGIELPGRPRVATFELCRYLADVVRDKVLASPTERLVSAIPEMDELLVLDEWNHPDVLGGAKPSESETFRLLGEVLATGDAGCYRPVLAPNTHWRHWPGGGQL
jgi:hypothetical protein